MTITDNIERDIAISDQTGSLTPVLQVLSTIRRMYLASGSFHDVCGELIRVVQDHSLQSPLYVSNVLFGECFTTSQSSTFTVVLPHTSFCTAFGTAKVYAAKKITSSFATSSNRSHASFSAMFAFHILLRVWISMIIQEMKIAEKKSKSTKSLM